MKKVRIIHLGYMHKYGDTRIFEKECKSLLKLNEKYDVDIEFITSNRSGCLNNNAEKIIDGIKVRTIPLVEKRFIKLYKYLNLLKRICAEKNADIYHIHELYLLPLVKFLKKRGKFVIYDKHEDTYDDVYSKAKNIFGNYIAKKIAIWITRYEKKAINIADGYIYVTPQHKIDNINTPNYLIPNFPKISLELESNNINKKSSEDFKICYCGGIADIWSIKEVSEYIADTDIKFDIAGNGSKNYIYGCTNNISNVNYLGMLPFNQVSNIYNNANVGVAMLKRCLGDVLNKEGTLANTKIFEYMQHELPVIFSDFPIWKHINDEFNFGVAIDINSKEEFLNAVLYIRNNPDIAKKMGQNGRKAILSKYNWEITENLLLNLYSDIIDNKMNL